MKKHLSVNMQPCEVIDCSEFSVLTWNKNISSQTSSETIHGIILSNSNSQVGKFYLPQINKYNLPSIPFDIIFHSMSRQLPAWWLYVEVLFWQFSLCTQRFHHKPGVAPKSNQAVVGALCATRGVWYDKGSTQPDFSLY